MSATRNLAAAAAFGLSLIGCSHGEAERSASAATAALSGDAKGAVEAVLSELAAGRPGVVWDALPKTYQSDLNGLVHALAEQVDGETYDAAFALARRLAGVLKSKKTFFLGHALAARMAGEDGASAHWDAAVGVLEGLANSRLSRIASLRSLDLGAFLRDDGTALWRRVLAATKDSRDGALQRALRARVELVASQGDRARLRLCAEGRPPEVVDLRRVEDRWVPAEIAGDWAADVAKAKRSLAAMDAAEHDTAAAAMVMAMIDSVLAQLERANTQREFDDVLRGVLGMAMPAAAPR